MFPGARELDGEGAAFGDFALHSDFAAVHLHNVFDDCQAKSGAAKFPAAGFVHSIEAFKDFVQMLLRDSASLNSFSFMKRGHLQWAGRPELRGDWCGNESIARWHWMQSINDVLGMATAFGSGYQVSSGP